MKTVVGYATIKKDATTGVSAVPLSHFLGKDVRVFEFNPEGDVMVIDNEGTGLATFYACDVFRSFKCEEISGVVLPPNLHFIQQNSYMYKCKMRKGGYNNLLKNMVIVASLSRGTFTDNFLWQKQ